MLASGASRGRIEVDWTIVVSVLVALLLWPLVVLAALIPALMLGRRLVRRRIRRALGAWREAGPARWRHFCGIGDAASPEARADA